ncbi:histidine phosphatase family protein [Moraxella sp. VT-16-12]|uniref:histidine phosphatase family protein n=1 Tax=Moraxella sp. VT-16-12 TaxID=2014877 RepID=UPI000B7E56F1|nr:histidine phosphatase family protein [Moraxella sp. VT-16-12]TWV82923.1 histidine phosphatase family protein [Moraxella sp. VT-16-12]
MLALSFIRHGQTLLLKQGNVLRGRTDDPLTPQGYQQMADTFGTNALNWQAIFSSPLSRCLLFAQDKAAQYRLPLFVMDDLQEIDFGDWENVRTDELCAQFPNELSQYWQTPHLYTPPNAERVVDFCKRINCAISDINAICERHHIQRACVICHGGVIKMLYVLAKALPMSELLNVPVALGEIHHFYYDGALKLDD